MPQLALPLPLMLAFLTAISPLAVDMYLPAMAHMAKDLNTDIHWVELSVSAYLIGFALGQLSGGPLSDRFGRRPLILLGLSIFALASLALTQVDNLTELLSLRVIQAIGGGLATVNSSAIVRDLYRGKDVARILSMVSMITMMAPLLAPVFGALTLHFSGWRTIFITLAVYGVVAFSVLAWQLPESHPKALRRQRFSMKDYIQVITHKRARRLIMVVSLSYSGMFIFITAAPYLYLEHFAQSASRFPLLFGANIIVMISMNRLNIALLKHFNSQRILAAGISLQLLCAATMVSLFSLKPDISLWFILPFMMFFVGTLGLIGSNTTALILRHFKDISATANALTGVSQFTSGAIAGLAWSAAHNGTPLPMVTMMLGCVTLSLIALWRTPAISFANRNIVVRP